MRLRLALLAAIVMLAATSGYASIGWAGHQWPCNGASFADNQDITLYMQVWKDGCTSGPGQCPGIEVTIFYKKGSDAFWTSAIMSWNPFHESGNDEYMYTIPGSFTESGDPLLWYYDVLDQTDGSHYYPTWISCGGGEPPWSFNITPATEMAVTVVFRVDMLCLPRDLYSAGVFFTGDFFGWNPCNPAVQMTDVDNDGVYEGSFLFPAGSNPYHEYKHNRSGTDGCRWEDAIGNRSFVIDDSQPVNVLPIVAWDNWDCCVPSGPDAISGPGSYCVTLCPCDEYTYVGLNVPYDPPVIPGIAFGVGCAQGSTNCNEECEPGAGNPQWDLVQLESGTWAIRLCLPRGANVHGGCFCMTIDQILPVELASFDAVGIPGAVRVDWATASETNNDHFLLERSVDRAGWSGIANIPSAGDNAAGNRYSFTDYSVNSGTLYYYRLTSVSVSGATEVHPNIVSATPIGSPTVESYALGQNYPNPFNPTTSISYSLKEAGMVELAVFDVNGAEVARLVSDYVGAGNHSVIFDASTLSSGVYFYRMSVNGFTATHKMVLMK